MIDVITGPMGSGKSETIIRLKKDMERNFKINAACFKSVTDTAADGIHSRNGDIIDAIEVESFADLHEKVKKAVEKGVDKIFVDEVQFIDKEGMLEFVQYIQTNDLHLIASGLNQTSEMLPFETMAHLAMYANDVHVLYGKCELCFDRGYATKCTVEKEGDILISQNDYIQTCCKCHIE